MARDALVEKALELAISAGRVPALGSHEWWTAQWKDLARDTHGLLPDDPRIGPLLGALAVCDHHYKAQDLDGFTKGAERVRRFMQFVPGAKVRWQGSNNHRLCILGPSTVEMVHCNQGRLWVWVWHGMGRWVCESIVTKIEGSTP